MQIYLLLNTSCNLTCPFCIRGKTSNNQLIKELWKEVLAKNDFSHMQLLLTGGEPSLHKNLVEIIELSRPYFQSIAINTNGVKSNWIDKLKHRDIHIQISLDGIGHVHNQIRTSGQQDIFSSILETVKKLELYNISYNISTTVGTRNRDNIIDLMNFLPNFQKMKYWKVSPQLPFGCGDLKHCISIKKWNNLVDELLENATVRLDIKRYFDFELLNRYISRSTILNPKMKVNCGDVRHKLYIYPNLTVYPCTCLTDFPLGNLREQLLSEIIASPNSQRFTEYTVNPESYCASCKYLSFCNGGCIGMSYHFFGKLGEGDYRCPLLQANRTSL